MTSAPRRFARSTIVLFSLATALLSGCRAPATIVADERPLSEAERSVNVASYDEMWRRVETTYFKPDRLSDPAIDWRGKRDGFAERIAAAPTQSDAREIMNEALATLGETHFAIAPGTGVGSDLAEQSLDAAGYVGIDLRPLDGDANAHPYVWRVEPGSPAAHAGIQPGWQLLAIDGRPIANAATDSPADQLAPMETVRHIDGIARDLAGRVGEQRNLKFKNGRGRTVRLELTATNAPDGRMTRLGNLPAMDLNLVSETLPSGVGYFSLSVFLNPPRVMPAFTSFIETHRRAPGLIIDLRGNPGGLGAMATGMCGFLVDRPGLKLGTMTTRDGRLEFIVNPRSLRYDGPVAVLVDGFSLSTSEILAGGLQDLRRARIFGERSPGAALPSTVTRLSNGDLFQYAIADYITESGRRLEGAGVMPDERVPLRRDDLLAGRDRAVEAAVAWIKSQKATTSAASTQPENP